MMLYRSISYIFQPLLIFFVYFQDKWNTCRSVDHNYFNFLKCTHAKKNPPNMNVSCKVSKKKGNFVVIMLNVSKSCTKIKTLARRQFLYQHRIGLYNKYRKAGPWHSIIPTVAIGNPINYIFIKLFTSLIRETLMVLKTYCTIVVFLCDIHLRFAF